MVADLRSPTKLCQCNFVGEIAPGVGASRGSVMNRTILGLGWGCFEGGVFDARFENGLDLIVHHIDLFCVYGLTSAVGGWSVRLPALLLHMSKASEHVSRP